MSENKLNKLIDTSRDERNHLWTSFLVLVGGSTTILIQNGISTNGLFAIAGLFLSFLVFFFISKKINSNR